MSLTGRRLRPQHAPPGSHHVDQDSQVTGLCLWLRRGTPRTVWGPPTDAGHPTSEPRPGVLAVWGKSNEACVARRLFVLLIINCIGPLVPLNIHGSEINPERFYIWSGKLLPYIQACPCYISQCKLFQSHRPLSVRSRLRTAWPAFTSWTRCSSGRPCASMSTKTLSITLWTSCTHCWASAWSPSLTVSVWRKQGRVRSTHTQPGLTAAVFYFISYCC